MHGVFLLRLVLDAIDPVADGRVSVLQPATVAPGAPVELSVTILDGPVRGMPIELALDADAIVLADNRFDARDVVDPHATAPRLRARVVAPAEPGSHAIRGRLSYTTCGATHCRPRHALVAWTVIVAGP